MKFKPAVLFILFLTVFVLKPHADIAQQKDSLLLIIENAKADTNKVKALNQLSEKLWRNGMYDTSVVLSNEAKELSKKIEYKSGLANACSNIGAINYNKGNHPDALNNHFVAVKIREEIKDLQGLAYSHNAIGLSFYALGNRPDALKNYLISLSIREKIALERPSDIVNMQGLGWAYNNVGTVYSSEVKFDDALKNYQASLKIFSETGNKQGVSYAHNNIAAVYERQANAAKMKGDIKTSAEKLSLALSTYSMALNVFKEIENKNALGYALNNIGSIYEKQSKLAFKAGDLKAAEEKYDESINIFLDALRIFEKTGNREGMAFSSINIGVTHVLQQKYQDGKKWLLEGLQYSKEIKSKAHARDAYNGLWQADSALGNINSAFLNYRLFIGYRDSLSNEENSKKIVQQEMQYNFDKKEASLKEEQVRQTAIANEESKRQKLFIILIGCVATATAITAVVVLRSLRITRKQKLIIESQKEIVEEKQKEILDSIRYAKRIQNSLLPTEKYIDRSIDKLQNKKRRST